MSKVHQSTLTGILGELRFHEAVIRRGWVASRPYDTSWEGYDFIIERQGVTRRIQVKVAYGQAGDTNATFTFTSGKGAFDFLIAQMAVDGDWYIIPSEDIKCKSSSMTSITVSASKRSKYSQFKNAWNLLEVDNNE